MQYYCTCREWTPQAANQSVILISVIEARVNAASHSTLRHINLCWRPQYVCKLLRCRVSCPISQHPKQCAILQLFVPNECKKLQQVESYRAMLKTYVFGKPHAVGWLPSLRYRCKWLHCIFIIERCAFLVQRDSSMLLVVFPGYRLLVANQCATWASLRIGASHKTFGCRMKQDSSMLSYVQFDSFLYFQKKRH